MTVTVIIVTLNRPDCVQRCLVHLKAQTRSPEQVIVVDASLNDDTRRVVSGYPEVLYLRNEKGIGKMTVSRNIGLRAATGDVIAFVDDDAFAEPNWLKELLAAYETGEVGAVGGRVHSNPRNAGKVSPEEIGCLTENGIFHANFWSDCEEVIDVEHVMGCNMSFRREVLAELGGFREFLKGISGVGEDTEMCVRVRRCGYRICFAPKAVVDHIGAPQFKGRRFDHRYAFFAGRNYTILLVRNFGLMAAVGWRYILYSNGKGILRSLRHPRTSIGAISFGLGSLVGWCIALGMLIRHGTSPARHDSAGEEIRRCLEVPCGRPRGQSARDCQNAAQVTGV